MYSRALLAAGMIMLASCGEVVQPGMRDGGSIIDADYIGEDAKLTECYEDSDCAGEHRACEWNGSYDECACAAGYSETAEGCTWTGGPSNAGFTDTSAWTVQGALINPGGTGSAEPGEVFFTTDAVCNLGRVSQTVRMPSLEQGEPLVAEIVYRSAGGGDYGNFDQVGPAFAVNGAWTMLPPATDWRTVRRCLSDTGYGGDVTFEVSVADKVRDCPANPSFTVSVDRFAVVPALPDECAPPGTAVNGNAEAEGGWIFTGSQEGAETGIADSQGDAGSRAARIAVTQNCRSANMTAKVVVPTPDISSSPALQFWWNGAAGSPVTLTIDGRPFTSLVATGAPQTSTFCLPPWTHGAERQIEVRLNGTVTGVACYSTPLDRSFAMDDVRITSTPSCSPESQRGFESAPLPLLGASPPKGATIEAVEDQSLALSGSGVLRLSATERCSTTLFETWVSTPAPAGSSGPAVKLWYNVPANPVTSASYLAGGEKRSFSSGTFPEGGSWSEQIVCLDPDLAGRLSRVAVYLSGGAGTCASFGGIEHAYFDDVEIGTDASCPVE